MTDPVYEMIFQEVRHALDEERRGAHHDAQRTLEGIVLMAEFVRHYRQRDPRALRMAAILRRLEWEWTPEGRLEWSRLRMAWDEQPLGPLRPEQVWEGTRVRIP